MNYFIDMSINGLRFFCRCCQFLLYPIKERLRFGRSVKRDLLCGDKVVGKIALIAIAKNEDNYIEEWIQYHFKLGVDEIFIYENDWRAKIKPNDKVHLIPFDGEQKQLPAYNDFLHNRANGFDLGIFIDVDEFIVLPNHKDLHDFLVPYLGYYGVGLNWLMFGDSGLESVTDGDYSVVKRFTRCASCFNKNIKTIVNLRCQLENVFFCSPHHIEVKGNIINKADCIVTTDCRHLIRGPFNEKYIDDVAWINHYWCKTREEYLANKRPRGRSDLLRTDLNQYRSIDEFDKHNKNESENLVAKLFFEDANN